MRTSASIGPDRSRLHNEIRITVSIAEADTFRKDDISCVIDRDVQIQYQQLENYCFRLLSDTEYDLVLLTGVVAFADRKVTRRRASGWSRSLSITLPVHEPERWQNPKIVRALTDALSFLSGDNWRLTFVPADGSVKPLRQNLLPLGEGNFVVMPFSNGLDSFALSQLLKVDEPKTDVIRVTTWNRSQTGSDRDWITEQDGRRYRRLSIPVRIRPGQHPEPTFRTRTFVFGVLAALAAHLSNANRVVIPENGQGSLGPSLVPVGSEWLHRSSHPGFTSRLAIFLNLLLGADIRFEHPHLWNTKGQVLQRVVENGLLLGWKKSISCGRDQRHVSGPNGRIHCGICGGCLLRRMSLFAAGIDASGERYHWTDLNAGTIAKSMRPDATHPTSPNDIDIGIHNALALEFLARAAELPADHSTFRQAAFDIAYPDGAATTNHLSALRSLILRHRDEWRGFTGHLGPSSWLRDLLKVV